MRSINHLTPCYQTPIVLLLLFLILLASGCKTIPTNNAPQSSETYILAHRASSGLWPQNSRMAINQSLKLLSESTATTFHGIEVDLVLTKDNVPVLSHDPWIHKTLCTYTDGRPVEEILIRDLTFAATQTLFRCGGIPDPEFPSAVTFSESIMGFDEFLEQLKDAPTAIIYLDVKFQPSLTKSTDTYAAAIFSRWEKSGLTNKLYVEGPNAKTLAAYTKHAEIDYVSVLSYPPFYANENWTQVGFKVAAKTLVKPKRALQKAQNAKAAAVVSPIQVMFPQAQKALQAELKEVIVFVANDKKSMRKACASGVNLILTDFPKLGPCPK